MLPPDTRRDFLGKLTATVASPFVTSLEQVASAVSGALELGEKSMIFRYIQFGLSIAADSSVQKAKMLEALNYSGGTMSPADLVAHSADITLIGSGARTSLLAQIFCDQVAKHDVLWNVTPDANALATVSSTLQQDLTTGRTDSEVIFHMMRYLRTKAKQQFGTDRNFGVAVEALLQSTLKDPKRHITIYGSFQDAAQLVSGAYSNVGEQYTDLVTARDGVMPSEQTLLQILADPTGTRLRTYVSDVHKQCLLTAQNILQTVVNSPPEHGHVQQLGQKRNSLTIPNEFTSQIRVSPDIMDTCLFKIYVTTPSKAQEVADNLQSDLLGLELIGAETSARAFWAKVEPGSPAAEFFTDCIRQQQSQRGT